VGVSREEFRQFEHNRRDPGRGRAYRQRKKAEAAAAAEGEPKPMTTLEERERERKRQSDAERARAYRKRQKAKRVLGIVGGEEVAVLEARKLVPGNKLRLTHGASDPERVAPLAEQFMTNLLEDPETDDYLRKPVMRHEVLAWAWAEAQVTLMRAWMDADGIASAMTELTTVDETEADEGRGTVRRKSASRKVSSLMSVLHQAEVRAANRRKELGLTPLARARLGKDIANAQFDLARYFAELDATEGKDAPKDQDAPGQTA
jgi:hypothetical protein